MEIWKIYTVKSKNSATKRQIDTLAALGISQDEPFGRKGRHR